VKIYLSPSSLEISQSGGMAVYVNSTIRSFKNLGFSIVQNPKDCEVWHELDGFNVDDRFFASNSDHIRRVVTIHDLQECEFPDRFSSDELSKRRRIFEQIAELPNIQIVAISEYTRNQIKRFYPALTNDIHVVGHAISHVQQIDSNWGAARRTPLAIGKFTLVLAKGWTHKNIDNLILEILRHLNLLRKNSFGFIFSGSFEVSKEISDAVNFHKAQDVISITGFLDEQTKDIYLSSAAAVLSASDHEGFGLVAYEAKRYGKKFIGFDLPVVDEIFAMSNSLKIAAGDYGGLISACIDEMNSMNLGSPLCRTWDDVVTDLIYIYWNRKLPLVSVVTSNLNRQAFLPRCIQSLDSQTYPSIEHIVIDGGSNDGSQITFKQRSRNLGKIVSEPDEGIYDAFNRGVLSSSGELIAFLNTDDWYEPDFLRKSVAIHLGGNANFTFGDNWFHDELLKIKATPGHHQYAKKIERNFMRFHHTTVLAQAHLFKQVGLFPRRIHFPVNKELKIAADYLWFMRVTKFGFRGLRVPGVIGHMQTGGISTTKNRSANIEGFLCAVNAYPSKSVQSMFYWALRILSIELKRNFLGRGYIFKMVNFLKQDFPHIYSLLRSTLEGARRFFQF
jgi:glycosyltransferase involved in cell wall biosynthesis